MKATILYGSKRYTDADLHSYYRQFLIDWEYYKKNTSLGRDENYVKCVIASYNEYYYQRKMLEREVYKKNNRSFLTKLVDNTFGMLYDDSAVKYSCCFIEDLPYREEVLSLIEKYGKWSYDNHKFVINI